VNSEFVPAVRDALDEAAYLAALQTLGLVPPVDKDAIVRAYRERAKAIHPDLVQGEEEKARATRRIQDINVAHAYALQHWQGFQLVHRWGETMPAKTSETSWHQWLLMPVTAVYALTTIVVAAPLFGVARLVGTERRVRWRNSAVGGFLWRLWLLAGPHAATVALFASVHEPIVRAWFGISFLVMLSADVATLATGDTHGLRRPIQSALLKRP
jgi:hypothetical protein